MRHLDRAGCGIRELIDHQATSDHLSKIQGERSHRAVVERTSIAERCRLTISFHYRTTVHQKGLRPQFIGPIVFSHRPNYGKNAKKIHFIETIDDHFQ